MHAQSSSHAVVFHRAARPRQAAVSLTADRLIFLAYPSNWWMSQFLRLRKRSTQMIKQEAIQHIKVRVVSMCSTVARNSSDSYMRNSVVCIPSLKPGMQLRQRWDFFWKFLSLSNFVRVALGKFTLYFYNIGEIAWYSWNLEAYTRTNFRRQLVQCQILYLQFMCSNT